MPSSYPGSNTATILGRLGRVSLLVLILTARSGAAFSQQGETQALDLQALCTAWRLTVEALKAADGLRAIAEDRIDKARALVAECTSSSDCAREKRINLEQDVRDANYAQVRALELANSMRERQTKVVQQLQDARGADALKLCGGG
jgi:hypothetical protein